MIFFAKSNHLLAKHKRYYGLLQRALAILREYNSASERFKGRERIELTSENAKEIIRTGLNEDEAKKLMPFFDDMHFVFRPTENPVKQLEKFSLDLKLFQNFEGKINFDPLLNIFNYGAEVYPDKMSRFTSLPDFDKKLIPDFMASSFALLWYDLHIHNNIRRPLEQYLNSLMANMNYQQFTSASQLKELLEKFFPQNNALIYVMGACPENFYTPGKISDSKDEYFYILKQRMVTANTVGAYFNGFMTLQHKQCGFFARKEHANYVYLRPISWELNRHIHLENNENSVLKDKRNVTRENVIKIMENYYNTDLDGKQGLRGNLDLVIVTSTFHIYKTALEIERYFFRDADSKLQPKNILIIGDESFYDLISHKGDKINTKGRDDSGQQETELIPDDLVHIIRKKKVKSFMFEIFQHALDKNSYK